MESYDIQTVESESLPISFQAGSLTEIQGRKKSYGTCRVIKDGKAGFYSSNTLGQKELIAKARELADYGQSTKAVLPKPEMTGTVDNYSAATADVPTAKMVETGREIIAGIKAGIGKELPIDVSVEKEITSMQLQNSEGVDYTMQFTEAGITAELDEATEGDIHSVFEFDISSDFAELNPQKIVDTIVDLYKKGRNPSAVPSGKYQVILHPYAAAQFLMPLAVGMDGERVKDKSSPLKDKLGQQIFDPSLTIWDDPFLPHSPTSAPFDGEGIVAERRLLVEKGVLLSHNHTLDTASYLGVKPTGAAARDFGGKPSPGLYNMVMEPGAKPVSELLAGMERGLYLRFMSGFGQANTLAGEFSMGVYSGFLVEKGEFTRRLKQIMIGGNIYDVFKQVATLSLERVRFSMLDLMTLFPYIVLDDVAVAGS